MKKHLLVLLATAIVYLPNTFAAKITVVTEEMPPYNFKDEKSRSITGMSTEIVKEILRRSHLDYSIELYPWAKSYRLAQDNPNVAIYSIARSADREKKFKWVGAVALRTVYLYKLKDRTDLNVKKLDDLKPYKLGGIRDGVRTQYLVDRGFTVETVSDDANNIIKLQTKKIDAFPADELALAALSEKHGFDYGSMEKLMKLDEVSGSLYLAFSLKTPDETVEKCRAALESMKKDGVFDRLAAKWQPKSKSNNIK